MGKYTHSKVLTETVDNAVGHIQALVIVSKWDVEKATQAAKNFYELDVLTMAVVSMKYKAAVVPGDLNVQPQRAIAQYTIDRINAHKAEHQDTRSEVIKAADKVLKDAFDKDGIPTHLGAVAVPISKVQNTLDLEDDEPELTPAKAAAKSRIAAKKETK